MKLSIGVDLHKTQFTVCMLSEDRKTKNFRRYMTDESGYHAFTHTLKRYEEEGYELAIAVESTGNTRYFRHRMIPRGIEVKVVNTAKFKIVNESVKKTDHYDAYTLAEFLEKDMLPESVLCTEESEQLRRIIKSRAILVKALVSVKNQIHGLLLSYGIESRRGELQSQKGRQRILCGLEDHKSIGNAALTVKPLFETIDHLSAEVKQLEEVLRALVEDDEVVKLLVTIPGVGLITATTIRAFTDDINRYPSAKKYSAYAGLVPRVQNSNLTIHHGHITKRGPVELRTAFVQMVMGMIRYKQKTGAYRVMHKYQRMKENKGSGKSIIATARKMSVVVWTMLKNRQPFNPMKMMGDKNYQDLNAALIDAVIAG
jgi:transposase